ncbi:MAG: ATP-binding cassette domain-containing protein [Bacillota bacterium]
MRRYLRSGIAVVVALAIPLLLNQPYLLRLYTTIALYTALGLGLTVTVGFHGLLDMGYVAFFGLGAYGYALLASPKFSLHLSFWTILPLAALGAALLAVAVAFPTRRLSGDYLAIVTLSGAEIVRLLFTNFDAVTNGPNGLLRLDPVRLAGKALWEARDLALLTTIAAVAIWLLVSRLRTSRIGRQWAAVRDDAIAASSLGLSPVRSRLSAFATGASLAAIAGVIFAAWQGAVFPDRFSMAELVNLFCIVILGGLGNPSGVPLGAALLVAIPELLRQFAVYRMLIYALLLIALIRIRPQGLWRAPLATRRLRRVPSPKSLTPSEIMPTAHSPRPTAGLAATENDYSKIPGCQSIVPGPLLKIESISRCFGGLQALKDVSFEVAQGQIVSLIGPNGAGKTTLLNVISGLTAPDGGDISLGGVPLIGKTPELVSRQGLARTFQHIRLFPGLDLIDNLLVGTSEDHKTYQSALALMEKIAPALATELHNPVSDLTYADRRRVEIIRALIHQPRVLVLDEPAAGMTLAEIAELKQLLLDLRSEGLAILLVEHQMDLVMGISDHVVVLDHGEIIAQGTPDLVRQNPLVIEAYLGRQTDTGIIIGSPGGGAPLLQVAHLKAGYGDYDVLHDLNLSVAAGESVVLLGANAAGKTTLMKTLSGTLDARKGQVLLSGDEITSASPAVRVRRGVVHVPEGRRVFPKLSVEENLRIGAYLHREGLERRMGEVFALFPRLQERREQMAGTLSGGEQQMLAIGRALMSKPTLLLLDEPSMGLAPVVVQQLFEAIAAINRQGVTVLMVEQNARLALSVAHRGYLLSGGRIVHEGSAAELLADEAVRKAYLTA